MPKGHFNGPSLDVHRHEFRRPVTAEIREDNKRLSRGGLLTRDAPITRPARILGGPDPAHLVGGNHPICLQHIIGLKFPLFKATPAVGAVPARNKVTSLTYDLFQGREPALPTVKDPSQAGAGLPNDCLKDVIITRGRGRIDNPFR